MTSGTVRKPLRARDLVGLLATGFLFFAFMTGYASAATGCGTPVPAGRHDMTIRSGGHDRHAVYFIPSTYTGDRKVPLVFDFHGSNSHPRGQLNRSRWDEVAEREDFVVMALEGSLDGALPGTHAWNVPGVKPLPGVSREGSLDEGTFIRDAVEKAKDTFCIDPDRIYASGYSGGGRMLSQYVCDGHEDFAAAGFVMGLRAGYPEQEDGVWRPHKESCHPARAISIIAFSGLKDHVNPFAGGGQPYWQYGGEAAVERWAELNGCEGRPTVDAGEKVTVSSYSGCRRGTNVVSYVIAGASHDWPARTIRFRFASNGDETVREVDATDRMWEFFRNAGGKLMAGTATTTACAANTITAATTDGGQGTTCNRQVTSDLSAPGASEGL
ncbi:alpha/beta hydrolase family esterase [Ciceribacter thiooxidans]|uniref:Alpha/beta hydrolase family esterase n=1 Tax=Ciceribacter thiooxidans TaxID=1969821 RepID=A0ABV7I5F6_9HYPH